MNNTILAILEENVRQFPQKTALADEYRSMTYLTWLRTAVRTARKIRQITGSDRAAQEQGSCPVGVLIDRNILSIAAFLGIAYSGNFYVPLDPALPAGRLEMIMKELSPVMLIDAREKQSGRDQEAADTSGSAKKKDPALPVSCSVPVLDIDSVWEEEINGPAREKDGDPAAETSAGNAEELLAEARSLRSGLIDTDPLYAIFTSGSTGVPKGVLVSHRSVLDLTDAFAETFGFAPDAVFGNQAPFDFDVSVKDIYNAIHCGGRVEVIPHRMFVMPAMLMEYLAARGVNTIIWAVSALRIVSDLRALDQMETSAPVQLRHIMFSGEVMPVKSINYWIRFFPDTVYVNLYGPTEITCNCTYHILDRPYENDEQLPIGRAFPNKRVFLLERDEEGDEDQAGPDKKALAGPCKKAQAGPGTEDMADPGSCAEGADMGVPAGGRTDPAQGDPAQGHVPRIIPASEPDCRGEICVEGTGVALGYWNDPARTAESFTAKPGAPAALNRIYRTGDLGYYNKEGQLMFAARADNQIKHMGHRIELGEIEACLNAIDFIDVGCCFYDQKKEKIICVYQAMEDRRKEIIAALSVRLPKYMRPNRYLRMQQMPLNAHAKIDRKILRQMYEDGTLR